MIGIESYAHAAQLQREYEQGYYRDLPRCAHCNEEFDPMDLVNGICKECAEDLFDVSRGRDFIADHTDEWHTYLDGEDMDKVTIAQYYYYVKEFCLEEMSDEWRSWLNV